MKKIFLKQAFTLIELIVSVVLLSIITLGIFSINTVLNNNNQDYGQRYLVRSETQATLNHILNNASLAVGSGANVGSPSVPDLGIVIWTQQVLQQYCFGIHQGANSNILNSNNDIWLVYCFEPGNFDIAYCTKPYNLNDPSGARGVNASCDAGSSNFLGSAYSISNPTPTFTATTGFSITIQNCLNDSNPPGTCSNTGTSADPVNNPEVQVSGSVFPPQDSW